MDTPDLRDAYASLLRSLVEGREEQDPTRAAELGREMVHADVSLEEIAEIHAEGVKRLAESLPEKTLLECVQHISAPLKEVLTAHDHALRQQQNEAEGVPEEQLRRFQQIVANTTDMVALVDRGYVYLAVNEAYLWGLDKASDEVLGRTQTEIFGEEFFNAVIRPHAERCLAGEDVHYQEWFELPAVGRRYMDVKYSPYRAPDGEVRGFVVSGRDVTEQKRLAETSELLSVAI